MIGKNKTYSRINEIPSGRTSGKVTEGTLILEGGAWRGIYSQGVLDAMMEEDITFRTTIGVSAGAMAGIGYVSGQIGWCARINLTHRGDQDYVGVGAMKKDHGITGFSHLFGDIVRKELPIDKERFQSDERRLIAVATNMNTGRPEYFEKGKCNIIRAVCASATVPYISRPVVIKGEPYLDGGCSVHIPYSWAQEKFPGKIMVIRTRDRSFRAEPKELKPIDHVLYGKYPKFLDAMVQSVTDYNATLDQLDQDEKDEKTFVAAPEVPITTGRFESDLEQLGKLYWQGYNEMKSKMPELKAYINE